MFQGSQRKTLCQFLLRTAYNATSKVQGLYLVSEVS